MELVVTNARLVREYIGLCERFNSAKADSVEEVRAAAQIQGFKHALQAIGFDWGTMLMDADIAAMDKHGSVPMCGGCLIK